MKIPLNSLTFGLFPIGTGNDLCRSLGWDLDLFAITAADLQKVITKYLESQAVKYDIWEVTLEVFKNGSIYNIRNKV
jgi:diacylglycerol kinase family enzyme